MEFISYDAFYGDDGDDADEGFVVDVPVHFFFPFFL